MTLALDTGQYPLLAASNYANLTNVHDAEVLLSPQRFTSFRRAVAVLCMALAVMLSGQTFISLMDRIDHAHHHAHFANPLAGGVEYSAADHDSSGHPHHHNAAQDGGDSHAPGSAGHHHSHDPADHQHGDAAIVFLAAKSFVLVLCPTAALRCEAAPPKIVSFSPRGPDHPPKLSLEIRV